MKKNETFIYKNKLFNLRTISSLIKFKLFSKQFVIFIIENIIKYVVTSFHSYFVVDYNYVLSIWASNVIVQLEIFYL